MLDMQRAHKRRGGPTLEAIETCVVVRSRLRPGGRADISEFGVEEKRLLASTGKEQSNVQINGVQ